MPVTNFAQVQRFSALCGATLSNTLTEELAAAQTDLEAVTGIGVRHAAQQGEELCTKALRASTFTRSTNPAPRRKFWSTWPPYVNPPVRAY